MPDDATLPTPKPVARLLGADSNVFNLLGIARRALVRAGQPERARELVQRAFGAKSYDEVLALLGDYVEVR